jgi:hypothetical protein
LCGILFAQGFPHFVRGLGQGVRPTSSGRP